MSSGSQEASALREHLTRAGVSDGELAPTTLELAREWLGFAAKVNRLTETVVKPALGPSTVFVHRSTD